MLSGSLLKALPQTVRSMTRTISIGRPCLSPLVGKLEQLCREKAQEYETKSSGGKMVEPTPEILKELGKELALVAERYGFEKGANTEEWPVFKFDEPLIDPIMEPERVPIPLPMPPPLAAAKPDPKPKPKPTGKPDAKPAGKQPPKSGGKPEPKSPPKPDPKKDPKKSKK